MRGGAGTHRGRAALRAALQSTGSGAWDWRGRWFAGECGVAGKRSGTRATGPYLDWKGRLRRAGGARLRRLQMRAGTARFPLVRCFRSRCDRGPVALPGLRLSRPPGRRLETRGRRRRKSWEEKSSTCGVVVGIETDYCSTTDRVKTGGSNRPMHLTQMPATCCGTALRSAVFSGGKLSVA